MDSKQWRYSVHLTAMEKLARAIDVVNAAKKVTETALNPLGAILPNPATELGNNTKNVASYFISPQGAGAASNLGYFTQIPSGLATAGLVNAGINSTDQLLEYAQKGIPKTLDDMKTRLEQRNFKNPVLNVGDKVFAAGSRPLISGPLGVRQGFRGIKKFLKSNKAVGYTPLQSLGRS